MFRFVLPSNSNITPISVAGGAHTPAQVHTILNPASPTTFRTSIVPHHISLGQFDSPGRITITGFDPGLNVLGLRTPAVLATDTGINVPGLPTIGQTPTASTSMQFTGLRLSPQGAVSGSLF
jgi:hypothetical protein